MAPLSRSVEMPDSSDTTGSNQEDKPTYDRMAARLKALGADHRIHGSMTNDQTVESLETLYNGFSEEYDDAYLSMGYESPQSVAVALNKALGIKMKTARVLDAGCGTGLVGKYVRENAGPAAKVDGVDISTDMLKVARKREVYNKLAVANLMAPLDIPTDSYDAVISTGVFTAGHVRKEALRELARVTRKGGYLVIGCQELAFENEEYIPFLEGLKKEEVAELERTEKCFTMKKSGTMNYILFIRVR